MNNFYINRLKTFSFAEFPYRIKQIIKNKLEEKLSQPPKPYIQVRSSKKILQSCLTFSEKSEDTINIFGKHFNYENIQPGDWHRDIYSGKSFPMSFSRKINIRKDYNLSAKCVWEINRLQFLTHIAIKYQETEDVIELNRFIEINTSWMENNPYLRGVNWYSNIEVNLRLITWFLCWELLDADKLVKENKEFNVFVTDIWLPMIYQHCVYSYKNPSRFSSANNHLISEYTGLFIASSKWVFQESEEWLRYSKIGLETEIKNQHSKNGINKEEAAEYIQFITDFFLLAYVVGENTNNPFSKEYKDLLQSIFYYLYYFLDCKGNFPRYGDEDDGKCFIVDSNEKFNNFKSLLTSGAVIFNDPELKSKSNGFDIKNQLLFGEQGEKIFNAIPDRSIKEGSKFYDEEGHFISRKINNDLEVYLHFDAAQLGFLSIAAHGHADALSFLLNLNGDPFFIDPGTYTYHTEPVWRNYFIGTLAHNTIRINKLNQATIGGSTLWLQHYKCKVLSAETSDDRDVIKATHNGYKRYGITHIRELVFDKKTMKIKITDKLESKTKHAYFIEMPFHLHSEIQIKPSSEYSFDLTNKKGRYIHLETDPKLRTNIVQGQMKPEIVGWYSNSFLHKEPTNTIICSLDFSGNIELETIISIY